MERARDPGRLGRRAGSNTAGRSGALGADLAYALHATAGNRAVAGAVALQRKQASDGVGMRSKRLSSQFADDAVAWFSEVANKEKSMRDYARFLVTKANMTLAGLGGFPVRVMYSSEDVDMGAFRAGSWLIAINRRSSARTRRRSSWAS